MRKGVVFIFCSQNYPHGFSANNTKFGLLAKGITEYGWKACLINKFYGYKQAKDVYDTHGLVEYITFRSVRIKIFMSIRNLTMSLKTLYKLRTTYSDIVIENSLFINMWIICLWTRILGYRSHYIWHEYLQSFKNAWIYRINAILVERTIGYFVSSLLPISEFLMEKAKRFNKPILKLPICADFSHTYIENEVGNYFLYCGNVAYIQSIQLLIDAMPLLHNDVELRLVLSGSDENIQKVLDYIPKSLRQRIKILSKLSTEELHENYSHAIGLLIPLDGSQISEQARFSQKIAEYIASCRPIITNHIREIDYYFTDGETAYIAKNFDSCAFAQKMNEAYENPTKSLKISKNAFMMGSTIFDYKILSKQLIESFS